MIFYESIKNAFYLANTQLSDVYWQWRYSCFQQVLNQIDCDDTLSGGDIETGLNDICKKYIFTLNEHKYSPFNLRDVELFLKLYGFDHDDHGSCIIGPWKDEKQMIVPKIIVREFSDNPRDILKTALHELDHAVSFQIAQAVMLGEIDMKHELYSDCKKISICMQRNDDYQKGLLGIIIYYTGFVERTANHFSSLAMKLSNAPKNM
jgi:hypothetical protein